MSVIHGCLMCGKANDLRYRDEEIARIGTDGFLVRDGHLVVFDEICWECRQVEDHDKWVSSTSIRGEQTR